MNSRKRFRGPDLLQRVNQAFLDHGYSALSMVVMAKACGFTQRALYYYFNNKEAAFRAIIEYRNEQAIELGLEAGKAVRSAGGSALDILTEILDVRYGETRRRVMRSPHTVELNAEAFKRLPVVRGYVEDPVALLVRPQCERNRQVFAEADKPSQLFQYYLLDTDGFEPNVFTKIFPGVNDTVQLTATGGNCGLPTVGAVRVVLEPKPGLPTDPNDPGAFIDVFTDISPLFVINNESGWYEGWMIHDLIVPATAPARSDGHAQFGTITAQDAQQLLQMGDHRNVAGKIFG